MFVNLKSTGIDRSAYKLMEIDEKFKIFKGGLLVVDLGAARSWSNMLQKL